jgi:OmpA-OmpF porin, OOP family
MNLDAVGTWPLTKEFSLLGRAGVQNANTKDTFTGSGSVGVTNPNPSKRSTNYKLGLGAEYDFAKEIGLPAGALRAEWERYRVDDALGSKADVDVLSLGLIYRF